ncbi:unnamed protein product [Coregonus sp. 'balchen']|nr:unnamed protein product [Coregonus sp. 'balchen']
MDVSQEHVSLTGHPNLFQHFNNKRIATDNAVDQMYQRTFRLDIEKTSRALYVVGTVSAPPSSKYFSVKCSPSVQYWITPPPAKSGPIPAPFNGNTVLLITMDTASEVENDSKLSVMYYGKKTEVLGKAVVHLTAVEISLDVDADRDGQVERNNPNKGSWMWGPNGHGAILLVNCDSEHTYRKRLDSECAEVTRVSDLKDMSPMVLRTSGPAKLPEGYKLTMHISQGDAECDYPLVVGSEDLSKEVPYLGGNTEMNFYVEGLRFPDKDFEGLISICLSMLEPSSQGFPETPIFTDRVMFRVAPWIMTPNTLNPVEVFVCSTTDNDQFLKRMRRLVENSGYKLKVCPEDMNRGDRWMQDEIEFGYIDSPHQRFPVVLDSPRNGALQDFPYDVLLGPDFGYVTRTAYDKKVSSLDSFGNLEVSPPVTGRNMTKVVQDFLWAQKVQEPIALFSDWLTVGHVDEFMTFVPAPDKKGFRLLLASPDASYKLFRGLQNDGHGQAKMFDGLGAEEITLDEILSDEKLKADNNYFQSCIDWNRDVLKRELGLDDHDIIDLPILFHVTGGNRAVAYYPDMVNMIVLGKNLGIPKPFGPKVDGRCALEAEMTSLMGGLGLSCTYIDDFASYHKRQGEVHCGSNVRREPFSFKWWNLEM